jgi:hypothetical protein
MYTQLALLVWFAALAVFVRQAWYGKTPVAGLILCYWLNLAALHLITEVLCLFYQNTSPNREPSAEGFPLTGYAVLGLMAGNLLLTRPLSHLLPNPVSRPDPPLTPPASALMAQTAIVVGLCVVLVGNFLHIPSLDAALGQGHLLAGGGFAWWWWVTYRSGRVAQSWCILAGSLTIPLMTLIFQGFLSFGFFALFTLAAFVFVCFRPRVAVLIAALPILYLGLSACVTYLHGRSDIRRAVWLEEADLSQRTTVAGTVFTEGWQWFDLTDEDQRGALDSRFSQNHLVGRAVGRINRGQMDYVYGETMVDAALSLIPRIIWRDKPVYIGGSEHASRFTGLEFGPGTTVGIGHVLEAYANFGVPGLLICFTALGAAIGVADRRAGEHLRAGRAEAFLMWFVPAQSLLNGGVGNFAGLTGGVAAGVLMTWLFLTIFRVVWATPAPLLPSRK